MNPSTKSYARSPFRFQGKLTDPNYFEGWYFKQVNRQRNQSISFIFGISLNVERPQSFIQVIKTNPLVSYAFTYPLSDFRLQNEGYIIKESFFSQTEIDIRIDEPEFKCIGKLNFSKIIPLQNHSLYAPSIMGPFTYIPNMECNHGVVNMRHRIDGTLTIDGEVWEFVDDVGYIEKDWGRSFPKRYVWLQGNHFPETSANFMLSVADIPFHKLNFEGVIAHLDLGHKSYRFATYYGAYKQSLSKIDNGFILSIRQAFHTLIVEAKFDQRASLKSPKDGNMTQTIKEGLGGTIRVTLKRMNRIIWSSVSEHCGIEIEGY